MYFRTEAAIDLDAVEFNLNNTRAKLGNGVRLLAVIKADAYGHGAAELGRFLEGKCDFFGVACIEEAIELKKAGLKTPIIILGHVDKSAFDEVINNEIRVPIFNFEDAKALSDRAAALGKTVPFHFCLDTGMSRIGFQCTEESADICAEIAKLPNIEAEGIFSHFATADEADLTKALAQQKRFEDFCKMLEARVVNIPIKHINNSAGIMNFEKKFDMCRMGIILYGLYPSDEVNKSLVDLKPVMTWKTHIAHIKTLEAGREISYGGTYKTAEPRIIATIPVGYADGYPRCLSNKGKVIINGKFAPITGRVCMDQFMVDVTDIDCDLNSEVILIGKQGDAEITMEEFGAESHSFNYEIPCRISRRVPRTYYKNGELIKAVNYLY